jgi:uncharacterized membrane protein YbhN (UPF0104 family)
MWPRPKARLLFGAAILVLVLVALDPSRVASALGTADARLVILGVLGLTCMHGVAAAGWRWMIAQRTGVRLPWRFALRAHYAAQALGSVTPGNLGSDFHRAAALRRQGLGWSAAVEPIVVQRATSYLGLSLLAVIGVVILSSASELSRVIVLIGIAIAALLVAAAWLLLMPAGPLRGASDWLRRRVEGSAVDAGGVHREVGPTLPLIVGGTLNGLLFHAGSVALTWMLVYAIDSQTPIWPMLGAIAVARLSLAVPLSPNGLGVQEGTLAALVIAMHLAPQPALAAMLVARLSTILLAAVGVALMLGDRPRTGSVSGGLPLSPADRR